MGCQDRRACRCAVEVREIMPAPKPTRCSARPITDGEVPTTSLAQDLPWRRTDDAGLRIDVNWVRAPLTLGSA